MAIATSSFASTAPTNGLDGVLYEVCEEVQLSEARHGQVTDRYLAVGKLLEADSSPFKMLRPSIYPQGSMALGTTVKPIEGPHDLDFVLELSTDHSAVDPMALIKYLFEFLKGNGTYSEMVEMKNRCVRLVYADYFYIDILPACRDTQAGGTCLQVPDRSVKGWKPSNPRGYIHWFNNRSVTAPRRIMLADAAPIPPLKAAEDKLPLQLAVQLVKRWRDLHYVDDCELAPISIVLTTLVARNYKGDGSVSMALSSALSGICSEIATANSARNRIYVLNPTNLEEDLSERWDDCPRAYTAFVTGIQEFATKWSEVLRKQGNVSAELKALFGETVSAVLKKRARRLQEDRRTGRLGVSSAGLITDIGSSAVRVRPNTFYGED